MRRERVSTRATLARDGTEAAQSSARVGVAGDLVVALLESELLDAIGYLLKGGEAVGEHTEVGCKPFVSLSPRFENPAHLARERNLRRADFVSSVLAIVDEGFADVVDEPRARGDDREPLVVHPALGKRYGSIEQTSAENRRRQAEFDKFLSTKIELAKASGQIKEDLVPTEEDIKQAKDYFAKTRIYYDEAQEKMPSLGEDFRRKTEIAVKLQQASYLSRLYAQKNLAEKVKVTDEDIQKYLAEHPELDQSTKRTKAEEILNRAKAGEDFAKLATEFTDDPGSKDKGGLYENITAGQFMPEFEQAALALEPGQISPNLVETTYGYHIIKLEKKSETKDAQTGQMKPSFNVRHILISTGIENPENPMGGPMPVKEFVTAKLEGDKEKEVLAKILADNPVEIADDFEIPKVSDEEMQQMMQQQMQQMQQQQNPQVQTDSTTTSNRATTSNKATTVNTPVKKPESNKK